MPASVISGKPGLDQYFGKKVILGIRPSDFEDAAFGDAAWPRIDVTAGVTEGLGTEIHAIFTIDAPPVEHASITSAARGDDDEDEAVTALAGGKSLWTARVVLPFRRPARRSRSSWPSTPPGCTSSTRPPASRSATRCPPASPAAAATA